MSDDKIRYRCPVCQKRIATYVPRGGDGSTVFFKRHRNRTGQTCMGFGMEATRDCEESSTKMVRVARERIGR